MPFSGFGLALAARKKMNGETPDSDSVFYAQHTLKHKPLIPPWSETLGATPLLKERLSDAGLLTTMVGDILE